MTISYVLCLFTSNILLNFERYDHQIWFW